MHQSHGWIWVNGFLHILGPPFVPATRPVPATVQLLEKQLLGAFFFRVESEARPFGGFQNLGGGVSHLFFIFNPDPNWEE